MAKNTRAWRFGWMAAALLLPPVVVLLVLNADLIPSWWLRLEAAGIETADESEIPRRLGTLSEWGEPAVPRLLELCFSKREPVARGARRELLQQLDRWRSLPRDAASRRVAMVASAAAGAEAGDSTEREFLSLLAQRLLAWPIDRNSLHADRFLADCERLIRAGGRPLANASPPGEETAMGEPRLPEPAEQADPRPLLRELMEHPAAPLPPEVARVPSLPAGPLETESRPPTHRDAGSPPREPEKFDPPIARRVPLESSPAPPRNEPAGRQLEFPERPWSELPGREVMELLHDAAYGERAREELRRRGFSRVELAAAERLTHDDPQVRRALAESLPLTAGIRPEDWLWELAADPHPEVRHAAFAILATRPDPATRGRLRAALDGETDTLIRALLEQVTRP